MTELKKKITLWGLTMIAVGSCIGSGIFVTPSRIVEILPHHGWILFIWALGGLISLTGALTFAELGGLFPKAGGVYVFLREAYGDMTGFLYGWVTLLVINTGALAALSIVFADYLTFFFPALNDTAKLIIALATIVLLTVVNMIGVNMSQLLANTFTGFKLLAIAAIIIAGLAYYLSVAPPEISLNFALSGTASDHLFASLLLALIGVLWSFGGWHHASYLAAETLDATRTVPRAMIFGALIVTVTYVLVNLAYMLLLPLPEIAATQRVAGEAVAQLFEGGGQLVALIIAVSVFGTISIYTMSAPRIYYAMARDGIFFERLSEVHPRLRTPLNAMGIQAVWAIILLLFWGTFNDLITYVTFIDLAFMCMAGASIFIFRRKMESAERPYRTGWYPFVPLVFVLITGAFVISTLIQQPVQAMAALVLLGLGIPVFYWFRRKREREE